MTEILLQSEAPFEEKVFEEFLSDRKIILNEEITDAIVERVIMQILKFNNEDKNVDIQDRKPIEIYLNSPGGFVDIGLVLCNVIKQSKTPVYITVLGTAASMASLILMSGHKRYAYPFSNVLIHEISAIVGGTASKMKDQMRFQEVKEKQIKKFILSNTKITEDLYDDNYEREWWITTEDALEYGIIDKIIGVDE